MRTNWIPAQPLTGAFYNMSDPTVRWLKDNSPLGSRVINTYFLYKKHREALPAEITYRPALLVLIYPSGKHTNQPVHLFPLVEFSGKKKRPNASFLRCYTQNMKELSVNQISLLARQKQFLHSLTHLWNTISHRLMAKPLWSVVGKALIKIYLTLLFPCLLSALSWK